MTNNSRYDRAQRMEPRADPRRKAATYHASPTENLTLRLRKVWADTLRLFLKPAAESFSPETEHAPEQPRRASLVDTFVNPGFNSHLV